MDINSCPICLDIINDKNYCITQCNHSFCIICISEFLNKNNDFCPCCRNRITVGSYKKKLLPQKTIVYGPFGIFKDKWLVVKSISGYKKKSFIEVTYNWIIKYFNIIKSYCIDKFNKICLFFNIISKIISYLILGYNLFNATRYFIKAIKMLNEILWQVFTFLYNKLIKNNLTYTNIIIGISLAICVVTYMFVQYKIKLNKINTFGQTTNSFVTTNSYYNKHIFYVNSDGVIFMTPNENNFSNHTLI